MKARLPKGYGGGGGGNMNDMIRKAQKIQDQMQEKQAELDEMDYTASSGGGMVEVTANGKHEIKSIVIKPEVVDPEDIDFLQDLIKAAVNDVSRVIGETSAQEMEKISGGLNIPGMGGMF
ncbi:MAG TPA: YbaB/EbfC family nucleoid-associated protein [Ruminococcaceae bacterium]|nr:YbaB/EbfC family nucleoid-associated protein [Oscillospiraceae bacterium]